MHKGGEVDKVKEELATDFWKYARSVLDDDGHTGIAPSFSRETVKDICKSTYSATPKSFDQPDWMPDAPPHTVPFPEGEITSEEVQHVIRQCKASTVRATMMLSSRY